MLKLFGQQGQFEVGSVAIFSKVRRRRYDMGVHVQRPRSGQTMNLIEFVSTCLGVCADASR